MNKKNKKLKKIATILLFIIIIISEIYFNNSEEEQTKNHIENDQITYETSNIPEFNGQSYVEINNNNPNFTAEDINLEKDYYSPLKNEKVRNGDSKDELEKGK